MTIRTYAEAYRDFCGKGPESDQSQETLAAVKEAAHRSRLLTDDGVLATVGWDHADRSPIHVPDRINHPDALRFTNGLERGGWVDHPYTLRWPDGRIEFVSEPYGLSGTAFVNLAALVGLGWMVSIDASHALWFPGVTVAVRLSMEGSAQ